MIPSMPKIKVPWWQDGETTSEQPKEPKFVTKGVQTFWQRIVNAMQMPLKQIDPLTCSQPLLKLHAWDRNIHRFNGEPEFIFRRRVKYAFINASDAGGKQGFFNIFSRMGITLKAQRERVSDIDWDVILIDLYGDTTETDVRLMTQLISQYGRTCRRYELGIMHDVPSVLGAAEFNCEWQTLTAQFDVDYTVEDSTRIFEASTEFNCESRTITAHWRN